MPWAPNAIRVKISLIGKYEFNCRLCHLIDLHGKRFTVTGELL